MPKLIDTHTHINYLEKITEEESVKNAVENGVEKILVPSAAPEDLDSVPELVKKYENVFGMLGIHPEDAPKWEDSFIDKIKCCVRENREKIIAIGEIGLDYYWDKSFVEQQQDVFRRQIKLANRLNLPIVVHDREAHKDCFNILKSEDIISELQHLLFPFFYHLNILHQILTYHV